MRALIISYQSQCKLIGTREHIWCFQESGQSPRSLGLDKRNSINMTKYWTEFSEGEDRAGLGISSDVIAVNLVNVHNFY